MISPVPITISDVRYCVAFVDRQRVAQLWEEHALSWLRFRVFFARRLRFLNPELPIGVALITLPFRIVVSFLCLPAMPLWASALSVRAISLARRSSVRVTRYWAIEVHSDISIFKLWARYVGGAFDRESEEVIAFVWISRLLSEQVAVGFLDELRNLTSENGAREIEASLEGGSVSHIPEIPMMVAKYSDLYPLRIAASSER